MSKYSYIFLFIILSAFSMRVFAETAEELKVKIDLRNTQIKQLEEEIKAYNIEVERTSQQSKTLQNTIKTLDLTKKKITTDISLTENKIGKAELTLEQLDYDIASTSNHITRNKEALGQMLKSMQYIESINIIETILANNNINKIWNDIENIRKIQTQISLKTEELRILKVDMDSKLSQTKTQKKQLVTLKGDLSGKKQVVENTTQEKATLLNQTKNKETAYKELIKTKEELKNQFEKELYEYEAQLNIQIDKNSYPKAKNGVLSWPLSDVYITQRFGKTVDSARLYTSGSHNGVDFRASIGTSVKSALSGIVVGTGNTDAYAGCYSFGKWVMIKHNNGLSTVYSHLSVIIVNIGQNVNAGDTLGYSGNTGYSTGPHLHFGLYATQGVRIEKYESSIGCKQVVMPLADIKAYLDPLAYLPTL